MIKFSVFLHDFSIFNLCLLLNNVFNKTELILRLKLNRDIFIFSSKETKKIAIPPCKRDYFASAPGVLPSYGAEDFPSNTAYTSQFYIATERK
ncbi:MAG TPA: hypothetical protein PKY86_08050 [Niabella sp.]|nr:hypothetical protein [Niabella sp.]